MMQNTLTQEKTKKNLNQLYGFESVCVLNVSSSPHSLSA